MRSQSAMEYLMTYGWAILIIAVVLAALFQLGVFSGGNLGSHATAGSCQVQKSTVGSSLVGECNGQLPEFVGQFNGQNSYISVPDSSSLFSNPNAVTVSVWIYLTTVFTNQYRAIQGFSDCCSAGAYDMYADWITGNPNGFEVVNSIGSRQVVVNVGATPANTWLNIIGIYSGSAGTVSIYKNGVLEGTITGVPSGIITGSSNPMWIGGGGAASWPGYIANLQIYNTSLSQQEVNAIYLGGIGGAPVRPQNLVGWWPLNGNANDYSGNNNNGQVVAGVTFSSSWLTTTGYTAP